LKLEKIKTYLGFSIRCGKVVFGVDKLLEEKKIPRIVIVCSTLNDKVSKKICRFCEEKNISFIKLTNLILSDLVCRDNCKVIGVLDLNLANAIKNEFQMECEIN